MSRTLPYALLLALALLLAHPETDAQSTDRVALVEQVTSASCGPCAAQNPAFNDLLRANADRVAVIKYQRGGGSYVDPMWSFNPDQVDDRITAYYGTFSFPQAWVNGAYLGTPAGIGQADLDAALAEPGWWAIELDQSYDPATRELAVSASFTALRDFLDPTDNHLRAHVVLIEDEVNYATAPGYNGETDFYWVMRRLLSGNSGAILGQRVAGESLELDYTYTVDEAVIDPSRLRAVAFVQTLTTQEVHQAAVYREGGATGIDAPGVLVDFALAPTVTDGLLTLSWTLREGAPARVALYDAAGRRAETLLDEALPAGTAQRAFVLDALAPGTWYAVLRSGTEQRVARFVVAR